MTVNIASLIYFKIYFSIYANVIFIEQRVPEDRLVTVTSDTDKLSLPAVITTWFSSNSFFAALRFISPLFLRLTLVEFFEGYQQSRQ